MHLYMFPNYNNVIDILGSDSAKKYCPTNIFPIIGRNTLFDKCRETSG